MGVIRGLNGTPAGQIVELLQRRGSLRVKDIESELGVTTTAVRQQLANLEAEGLVAARVVREGVGRPHFVYSLTGEARDLFACHCDELASLLYDELRLELGQEKVLQLLERVGKRLASRYREIGEAPNLPTRVHALAQQMESQGILADVAIDSQGITLREYNCPYHDLSLRHREICLMERDMIGQVLGTEVTLQKCMHDGHSGCTFVVELGGSSQQRVLREAS